MNADEHRKELNKISDKIIGCVFKVSNKLGVGFLEKVYENALCYELKKINLNINQQFNIKIEYENIIIGEYCADILVENEIIIELKVVSKIDNVHIAQCINYLKSTNLKLCLLINFGNTRVDIKRLVHNF